MKLAVDRPRQLVAHDFTDQAEAACAVLQVDIADDVIQGCGRTVIVIIVQQVRQFLVRICHLHFSG